MQKELKDRIDKRIQEDLINKGGSKDGARALTTVVLFSIAVTATINHLVTKRKNRQLEQAQLRDEGKLVEEGLDPEIERAKAIVQRELKKSGSK